MKHNLIVCLFLIIGLSQESCAQSTSCDENSARILGRLYYLSLAINVHNDPQSLESFVQQNSQYLQANSTTILCCRNLGQALVNQGISSFSKNDYNDAMESVINMGGNYDQAQKVASSINQGSIDALIMGEELIWLSQVIPTAANGDWSQFINSGTQSRQTLRQILPMYQSAGVLDPEMTQLLNSVLGDFQPIIEDQIVMLALMLGS